MAVTLRRQRALAAALLAASGLAGHAAPPAQPNIVVLVADDWGYTDVGAYGGEIATPNIDALARRGVKFSNFHVSATCSPSRAMLLTGVDNHRNGVGNMPETMPPEHEGRPGYAGVLGDQAVTLATMLRDNGYHTYITGKWHLGKTPATLPGRRGFERSFIQADSGSDNWENRTYMLLYDRAYWFEQDREASPPEGFYSSTFFVDKALEYIASPGADGRPFFAYIGFQANHIPIQAPRAFVEHYRGRYDGGWTALRKARQARARALGLVPAGAALATMARTQDWDSLSAEERRWHARHMEAYAGMAEAMDAEVGRLVAALKAAGRYDNTVFVFLSDNGSDPANPFEIPVANAWVRLHYVTDADPLGGKGTFSANGRSWASATNSPLSGYKYFASEGGLRVPMIIAGVPGMAGDRTASALAHINDIVPTLLQATGIALHDGHYRGRAVETLSGCSMLPLLLGQADRVLAADEAIGYELAGSAALFKGDCKLVRNLAPLGDGQWHLYDLAADPGEAHDLRDAQPARVKAMQAIYDDYARRNGVLPMPEGFDLEKTALHYAVRHALVPRLWSVAPWALAGLSSLLLGVVWIRRRRGLASAV